MHSFLVQSGNKLQSLKGQRITTSPRYSREPSRTLPLRLIRSNGRTIHVAEGQEAILLSGLHYLRSIAGHIVDESFRQAGSLAFRVHMLDIPEFVGVVLDVRVAILNTINLQ